MGIIFRHLEHEEKRILGKELDYWIEEPTKEQILEQNSFIIAEGRWRELLMTNHSTAQLLKKYQITPYTIGLGLGEFQGKDFLVSLSGGSFLSPNSKKIAIVNSKAEQAFLFKNPILEGSVMEINRELNLGDKIFVLNKNSLFLGIGQLVKELKEWQKGKVKEKRIIIKNLMDLGWYLRKGR
jgi:ribosome biogenesis protein Nip4